MRKRTLLRISLALPVFTCAAACGPGIDTSGCGSGPLFTVPLISASSLSGIVPLGGLNPPGHVFPTNHIYFYPTETGGFGVSTPVVSPGNITITQVVNSAGDSGFAADYTISFTSCLPVTGTFGHVATLSASLLARLPSFSSGQCTSGTEGNTNFQYCTLSGLSVALGPGDSIGTAGGVNHAFALDFGLFDSRVAAANFISPGLLPDPKEDSRAVCAVDYFDATDASAFSALFGNFSGTQHRTAQPVCGTYAQDLAGTVQGKWFFPGAPNLPDNPHLALVHDDVDPSQGAFSVGSSLTGATSAVYEFTPASSGQTRRDFGQVTADGNVYCYDSFGSSSIVFILQLVNASTLRIEQQSAASCGAGPWSFTANHVDYQR